MSVGGQNLGSAEGRIGLDIADALRKADIFKGVLSSIRAAGDTLARGMSGLSGALSAPFNAVKGLTSALGGIGVASLGVKAIADSITGVTRSLIAGNAQMETYETQLGTLLGSADKAKERLAELARFGAQTPFELPEVVKAEKVLLGFGLTGQKAIDLTKRNGDQLRTLIGDIAAGTGAGFDEIALNFGKFSAGATGEAIARFQELGIVTREQMAALGVEFSKSGELLSPLPVALSAALDIAQQKFGGGMEKLSQTVSGKLSNLSDALNQNFNKLTQGIFKQAGPLVDALNSLLGSDQFAAGVEQVSTLIGTTLSQAVDIATTAYQQLAPVVLAAYDAITKLLATGDIGSFVASVEKIFKLQPGQLEPLRAAIQSVRDAVVTFIGAASGTWQPAPGIEAFHQAIGTIGLIIPQIRDAVLTFIGALQGNWQPAPGISLFSQVVGILGATIGKVRDGVSAFLNLLANGGQGASGTTPVQDFLTASQRLSDFLGGPGYDAVRTFIGALQGNWQPAPGIGEFAKAAGDTGLAIRATVLAIEDAITGAQRFGAAVQANVGLMTGLIGGLGAVAGLLGTHAVLAGAAAIADGLETAAIWAMVTADTALAVAQRVLNAAMSANPIGIIIALLTAAAAALIYAYNNSEDFRNIVNALWAEIQKAAGVVGAFVVQLTTGLVAAIGSAGEAIGSFITTVGTFFGQIGDLIASGGIGKALSDAWSSAGDIVASALQSMSDAVLGAFQSAADAVSGAVGGVADAVGAAFGGAADAVGGAVATIGTTLGAVVATVVAFGQAVGSAFGALPGVVLGAVSAIGSAIGGAFTSATQVVQTALTVVADAVVATWTAIVGTIEGVRGQIADAVHATWDGLVAIISAALAGVRDAITAVWNQIPEDIRADLELITRVLGERFANTLAAADAWVQGLEQSIRDGFAAIVGAVGEAIGGIVSAVAQGFADTASTVEQAVGGVAEAAAGAFAGVQSAVTDAIGAVAEVVGSAFDAVAGVVGTAVAGIAQAAQDGWDAVAGVFSQATQAVIDTVTSWADSLTGSLATSFDGTVHASQDAWSQVSDVIMTAAEGTRATVSDAFTQAATVVGDTLNQIGSAVSSTWDTVVAVVGQAMADFIDLEVRGLTIILETTLDIIGQVERAIGAWVGAILDLVRPAMASLLSTVTEAWDGVQRAVGTAVDNALNSLRSFADNMGNAVRQAAAAVGNAAAAIGSAIVDGIVAGVQNAAAGLGGALGNVVRQALGFVKNVADIHSPSGLFADEVGKPIGEGIIAGIEGVDLPGVLADLIDLVVQAGKRIGDKATVDRFKSVADAISASAGAVQSVMQSLGNVSAFVRPSVEQLVELRGAMADVLVQMDKLGSGINQKVADRIKLTADAAGGALQAFGQAVQALTGAAQFQGAGEHQIALAANGIENVLGHLADIGTRYTGPQFARVRQVADAATAASGALAAALKPLTDVNAFGGTSDVGLQKAVDGIEAVIGRMADLADRFPRSALGPVQALAGTVQAAFQAVSAALEPLTSLRSFVAPSSDLDALFTNISGVLVRFRDLSLAFTREQASLTAEVGKASQDAFTAVAKALDIIPAIGRAKALGNIDATMSTLRDRIILVVGSLRDAAVALGAGAAAQAGNLAENAAKVFTLVEQAIASVRMLGDLPSVADINRSMQDLGNRIISIVRIMGRAADSVGVDAAKSAGAFAEGAGKVVGLIGDGIAAITKLSDLRLGDISGAILTLSNGIVQVVRGVADAATAIGTGALADAASLATDAKSVVDLIGAAVDSLTGLAAFRGVPGRAVALLGAALIEAVREIVRVTRAVGDTLTETGVQTADRIQKALGVLGTAVDFAKLADFKPPSRQQIDAFFNVLRVAVDRLVEQARPVAGQIAEQVGQVGEQIGKAFGALKDAIDFFLAAQDFNPGKGFADKLGGIVGLLGPVLSAFKNLAAGFQDIAPLTGFAQAVSAIAKALSDFVDAASKAAQAKGDLGAVLGVIGKARDALALAGQAAAATSPAAATGSPPALPSEIRLIFSGGIDVRVQGVEGAPGVAASIAEPTRDEIQGQTLRLLARALAG